MKNSSKKRRMIERAAQVVNNARAKPEMYFNTISPLAIEQWLFGLQTGLGIAGVEWSLDSLSTACEKRCIKFTSTISLTDELHKQGLSDFQIAMTLLEIAEEMWRGQLSYNVEPRGMK